MRSSFAKEMKRRLLKRAAAIALILCIYPAGVIVFTWSYVLKSDFEGGRNGKLDAYRHSLASATVAYTLGEWAVDLRHGYLNRAGRIPTIWTLTTIGLAQDSDWKQEHSPTSSPPFIKQFRTVMFPQQIPTRLPSYHLPSGVTASSGEPHNQDHPAHEESEQDSGGNGGQRPSFASLWTSNLRRATLMTAESNMIGELNELHGWLRAGTAGWRFLFIRSYRQQIMSGWRFERWYYVAWDIACGLAGIAFSLLLVVALVYLIADLTIQ